MTKSEIEQELKIIGDDAGIMISYTELSKLSESEKEDIIGAYYSHDLDRIYNINAKRQLLDELKDVAGFLQKPYDELSQLPNDIISQLCGTYAFEADNTPVNELRGELIQIIERAE